MKDFKYGDEYIGERELFFAIPSLIIGVAVLSMPMFVAKYTVAADGVISIFIAGIIVMMFTWLAGKLAMRFNGETFYDYAKKLVSRPVAVIIILPICLLSLLFVAMTTRYISDIALIYLFSKTPKEVIALSFLLIVIYAVSGSRAGLFRLNIMFLPIIIFVVLLIFILNVQFFEADNFLPVFKTDMNGYLKSLWTSLFPLTGYSLTIFYIQLVRRPKKIPKITSLSIFIPMIVYIIIYLTAIGVFSNVGTSNILYGTIELAKRIEAGGGGIFERIESIFFVIWSMAIFTTAMIFFDVSLITFNSIFKKINKMTLIYIFSPIIYFVAMLPRNYIQVDYLYNAAGHFLLFFEVFVILFFLIIGMMKRRDTK